MKEDWNQAINFVLKMEGGSAFENDPDDPGGETRFGISKKAYPNLDIRKLTLEQAVELYHRDYWIPCRCDDLPTALSISVFDCAVNQGVSIARRLLQMALDVTVDGHIGPITLAAAAKAGPYRVKRFLAERMAHYCRVILAKPNLVVFAVNWSNRVLSLALLVSGGWKEQPKGPQK